MGERFPNIKKKTTEPVGMIIYLFIYYKINKDKRSVSNDMNNNENYGEGLGG